MIAESLLPEFDQECATTRKHLARTTADRFDWAPHEKSMTLGKLASHLAELLVWASMTIEHDEFDMAPIDGEPMQPLTCATPEEILAAFDQNVAAARKAIEGASDDALMATWTLKTAGEVLFEMPKIAVIKTFVINHTIHHRGQLSVYLRLCGLEVLQTYGPTADEPDM